MRAIVAAAAVAAIPLAAANASPIEVLKDPPPTDAPEVKIEATQFSTPEIRVKAGSAVKWVNADGATHNVHFRHGPAKGAPNAQGPTLNAGDAYVVKFSQTGQYEYIDTLHSTMKGKIIVE